MVSTVSLQKHQNDRYQYDHIYFLSTSVETTLFKSILRGFYDTKCEFYISTFASMAPVILKNTSFSILDMAQYLDICAALDLIWKTRKDF